MLDTEMREGDLVAPHLPQQIAEELNVDELTRTATVAEAMWGIPSVVAQGIDLIVDLCVDGTKHAVWYRGVAAILDVIVFPAKRALGQSDLLASGLIVLRGRRRLLVPIGIEVMRVAPVRRVDSGFQVRRDDGVEARVPCAKGLSLRRQRRNASGVGRDGPEQLHDETVQPGERRAIRFVGATLHRLSKPRADSRVPGGRLQAGHHVIEHVAPLTERQAVVETFED